MKSGPPGETKKRVREALLDGSASAAQISARIGVGVGNVRQHLNAMLDEQEAIREFVNGTWIWSLSVGPVQSRRSEEPEPKPEPEAESQSDRLKLVEELLEIEKLLVEMQSRRSEILGALSG